MRRRAVVIQWRTIFGSWCPGYQRPGHHVDEATNPLCADHVVPVAAGGSEEGALAVLCRSCNSAKREGRNRTAVRRGPVRAGWSRVWVGDDGPSEIHSSGW